LTPAETDADDDRNTTGGGLLEPTKASRQPVSKLRFEIRQIKVDAGGSKRVAEAKVDCEYCSMRLN
jgi:hypothetical protein